MLSDFWKIQVVNYLPEHPLNLTIQDMRTSVLEQGIGEQSSSYFTLHPQGWSCHSVTSPASRVARPNLGNNALPECLFWAQDGTWHPDAPDLPPWVNMTLGTSILHPTEHEEGGLQEMHVFYIFSSCSPIKNPTGQMHLLTFAITATNYSENRTFSNWGRKENKICLLSTQEKLMNSCKSTPKSEMLGSENEWNFNWIQTFPCVHVDSIYYCNYKGQAHASLLFKEMYQFT